MSNKKLVLMLTAIMCLALSSISFAVTAPAKPAAKPATKPAIAKAASKPATTKTAAKPAVTKTVVKPAVKKITKPAAKPEVIKVAAKPAAKKTGFNQKAVLDKFWGMPDSTVVGNVSGASITKGELIKAMWYRNAPFALSELLDQKMIDIASKKAKVAVSPSDVKKKIDEIVTRSGGPEGFQLALTQHRYTESKLEAEMKSTAQIEAMVKKDTKITPAECAEYIKARHILILFPRDIKEKDQQEAAAKAKADDIEKRIKNGEDFSKIAMEVSEDPGSKPQGGDLGWFNKGRMVPEFETAAFALEKGQISEPVKSGYGYHIIKLEAKGKDATGAELTALRDQILKTKAPTQMGQTYQNLKDSCKPENMLAAPEPKNPNAGMMPPSRPSSQSRPSTSVPPRPTSSGTPPPPPPSEKPSTPPPPPPPAQ